MKSFIAIALFVFTTSLFAATPYSFKCVTASDGACSINTNNAHVMREVQAGFYSGTEGEYQMFASTQEGSTVLFVYKGSTELAQAEGKYLAVPTTNGYAGVILVENLDEAETLFKPAL